MAKRRTNSKPARKPPKPARTQQAATTAVSRDAGGRFVKQPTAEPIPAPPDLARPEQDAPQLATPVPERDAKGRFQLGVSGNPAGRPPARRATRSTIERLLTEIQPDGQTAGEALIRSAIQRGIAGDNAAAALVLDRVVPRLRPTDEPRDDAIVKDGLSGIERRELAHAAQHWLREGGPRPDADRVLSGAWRARLTHN